MFALRTVYGARPAIRMLIIQTIILKYFNPCHFHLKTKLLCLIVPAKSFQKLFTILEYESE